jgi:UDP-N-acetylmuramyl pentapeptide phosphotransferase/UDP-N-acetylglucosamine-1-phosphate transferase
MIRRKTSNMPISMADKQHLHHRLLNLGFTHRGAVLTIYAIAVLFSFTALLRHVACFTTYHGKKGICHWNTQNN